MHYCGFMNGVIKFSIRQPANMHLHQATGRVSLGKCTYSLHGSVSVHSYCIHVCSCKRWGHWESLLGKTPSQKKSSIWHVGWHLSFLWHQSLSSSELEGVTTLRLADLAPVQPVNISWQVICSPCYVFTPELITGINIHVKSSLSVCRVLTWIFQVFSDGSSSRSKRALLHAAVI